MKIVKITVLETSLRKDFAERYAVAGLEPCPVLKVGQVFYATNTCPKGCLQKQKRWNPTAF